MTRKYIPDHDINIIVCALHLAANQYNKDAEASKNNERLHEQFRRQQRDALRIADAIENNDLLIEVGS